MPVMQPLVISFLLPSLFILFLSTPAWSNDSSTVKDMMEDMGIRVPDVCRTPTDLENIFYNKCFIALLDLNKCVDAWIGFTAAFGFKDPNTITPNDYNTYFNVIPVISPPNSVLFWSGVRSFITALSHYPTISSSANQHSSLIFNAMRASNNVKCWCGDHDHKINTENPCPPTPYTAFWEEFSVLLAQSANGIAFWVGYGNRDGGAYDPNSFFGQYEFPNLNVERLVVIDIYHDNGEQCGQGSLLALENLAVDKFGNNGYRCHTIYGDPTNSQEFYTLAVSAHVVIEEEQQGKYISSYVHLCQCVIICLQGQLRELSIRWTNFR